MVVAAQRARKAMRDNFVSTTEGGPELTTFIVNSAFLAKLTLCHNRTQNAGSKCSAPEQQSFDDTVYSKDHCDLCEDHASRSGGVSRVCTVCVYVVSRISNLARSKTFKW